MTEGRSLSPALPGVRFNVTLTELYSQIAGMLQAGYSLYVIMP